MIFGLLFEGFRFGVQVWQANDEKLAKLTEFQSTHRVLRQLLESAQPAAWGEEDDGFNYVFEGTSNDLRLVATGAIQADLPGPILYRLAVSPQDGGATLELTGTPYVGGEDDPAPPEAAEPITLIGPAQAIAFSYFGRPTPDSDPGWFDDWDRQSAPPILVRIEVDKGAGEVWPTLSIPVVIDMDAACIPELKMERGPCRLGNE